MSEGEKTFIAILASVILHGIIAGIFAIRLYFFPSLIAKSLPLPQPEMKQLEVTLVSAALPTPPPVQDIAAAAEPTPPPKISRHVLDTDGLQESETPPENAPFESDKNSRAASELPATGDAPLPTQEGRNLKAPNFVTQDFSMGRGSRPAPDMEATKAATPVPPSPVAAAQTPEPVPQQTPAPQEESNTSPAPTPFSNPTPAPTAASAETPKEALALGKPTPVPVSTPNPRFAESQKPTPVPAATPKATPQQLAKLTATPPPLPEPADSATPAPAEPGTQVFKEKTKIDGGIRNRGKGGVDAVASPMGKYSKTINDIVGARWNYYMKKRADLVTAVGQVVVTFKINSDGTVDGRSVKILSNTANDGLATITKNAILESKLPAVPEDLAPFMDNGQLEIRSWTFTCYDLNQ